jgi:2-methylcitrate dehydratase PrpD
MVALSSRRHMDEQCMSTPAMTDPMDRLSCYMAEAANRPLPPEIAEKCRLHLLDTIGAIISGGHLLPGRRAIDYARLQPGGTDAAVLGTDIRAGAVTAALTNGMLGHADETDDSHSDSRSHPGCSVVPAALAMAEKLDTTGENLLRAIALGYDIGTRVVRSLGTGKLYDAGHATHAFSGGFGAAAAAGSIAKFDPQQFRWLLSYAAQQTAGITSWRRDVDHIEKAFVFGGMPARNGISAALMVAAGFTGVDDVFSGNRTFFTAFGQEPDPAILIEGLGEHYALAATTIKKWSVGSPSQPVLDLGYDLIHKHNIHPEQIACLKLRLSLRESVVLDQRMADINVKHLLAVQLIDRELTFASSHDIARVSDPAVLAFQEKIDLGLSPELEFRRPAIELTLTDGQTLTLKAQAVRGSPANPMSRQEVVDKATRLMRDHLGDRATRDVVDIVWRLGPEVAVTELVKKLMLTDQPKGD